MVKRSQEETHITGSGMHEKKQHLIGCRVLRKARLQVEQKGKEDVQKTGAAQFSARVLPGHFVPLSFF